MNKVLEILKNKKVIAGALAVTGLVLGAAVLKADLLKDAVNEISE